MTRHGGRPRVAAIVSVAALLVATSSACGSATQSQPEPSASSSAVAAAVGHKWRLTRVTVAAGRQVDVPDSIDATFQLTSDGRFGAFDTVNGMSGTYTATRTGFTVTSGVTTLIAYEGTDPTRLAVIASMDAVLEHNSAVAATTTGTTLTLNRANYRLTFRDAGPAVSYPPPSATPTTTPTHS